MRRLQRHKIGLGADREAITFETQGFRAGKGHHVEGGGQFVIRIEAGAIADDFGAAQHVAIAIGPPRIADIVAAGEDIDALGAQQRHWREGVVARRIGHDRHAAFGNQRPDLLRRIRPKIAKPIGMADGHAALHAERRGSRADLLDGEDAERAEIMQVDIDIDAMLFGDAEDDAQMRLRIAVETGRVEAADRIRPEADGGIQQFRRAGAFQDAVLREGDKLDIDAVAIILADFQNGFQRTQPDRTVDHHMAAHLQGAVGDAEIELVAGALIHRRGGGHVLGLKGHALMHVETVGAGLVRDPAVAVKAGVEMDMALDKSGNDERAAEIHRFGRRRSGTGRRNRGNAPVLDGDVTERSVTEPRTCKKPVHHGSP